MKIITTGRAGGYDLSIASLKLLFVIAAKAAGDSPFEEPPVLKGCNVSVQFLLSAPVSQTLLMP